MKESKKWLIITSVYLLSIVGAQMCMPFFESQLWFEGTPMVQFSDRYIWQLEAVFITPLFMAYISKIQCDNLRAAIGGLGRELIWFTGIMFFITYLHYEPYELYISIAITCMLSVLTYIQYKNKIKNKRTLILVAFKWAWHKLWE